MVGEVVGEGVEGTEGVGWLIGSIRSGVSPYSGSSRESGWRGVGAVGG